MVARVNSDSTETRRAKRLLNWYPKAWRERYGEEFVDHLEQEFADNPVDFRRSLNIACKGIVARLGDFGFSRTPLSIDGQSRAALATSFALTALSAVLVLNFWSVAMLQWSARKYHPIPVSATTGILSVAAALMMLVLVAIVLMVVVSVARQCLQRRSRKLIGPAILALGSGAVILYAVRPLPRMFAAYSHMFQGGFRWTHPGPAMYGLAYITNSFTQWWVAIWNPGESGLPTIDTVVNNLVPLAVLLFGLAIATLLRRVELPQFVARFTRATVMLLGVLTGVAVVTHVAWLAFGGPSDTPTFGFEGSTAGAIYIAFLALVAVLIVRTQWVRGTRNEISVTA
jgi:hypothetical protein